MSKFAFSQYKLQDLTGEEWYLGKSVGGNLTIAANYIFLDSVNVKTIYSYSHSNRFVVSFEGKYNFNYIKNELFIKYDKAKTKIPHNGFVNMINQLKNKETDYFKFETVNDSLYKVYHTNNWLSNREFTAEDEIDCINFREMKTSKKDITCIYIPKTA